MTIFGNFEHFQYFNFETNFPKNTNPFQKTGVPLFSLKVLRLKTQHFLTKLSCHKPMLRQMEWGIQNESITKNRVLPVTTLFFRKLCFSLRISHKDTPITLMSIFILFESIGVFLVSFFPLSIRDHSFSTYAKFSEKLSFCTP